MTFWVDEPWPSSLKEAVEVMEEYEPDEFGPSWVYFAGERSMQVGEVVKIGRSRNPRKRMEALTPVCGFRPRIFGVIPGAAAVEIYIHEAFSYLRDRREKEREWFRVDPHLLSFFSQYAERDNDVVRIGNLHPRRHAKPLTEQDAIDIRNRYGEGGVLMREIANDYGVSISTVQHTISGRKFAHITEPAPIHKYRPRRSA